MATAPLPVAIVNQIKARNQSVRWAAILREVREFRAYCCNIDSDSIMNVSKEPVVILTLSPNPICLGNAMSWSFVGSYAPGSTVTSRDINFGDTNTDSGVSGNHTYAAAGTFTVTATVTEGGGTTQTVTEEVNVIDCSDSLLLSNIYASTDGSGVFYWE
jgi:PKD repeat protein